jgi:hypothetical protein
MPLPIEGETLEVWAVRAREWKRTNRQKPGRRGTPTGDPKAAADLRFRLAKAELAELDLAVRLGQLHSQQDCESLTVRRFQELRNVFAQLPDTLARKLYQAPSPDAIKVLVEAELRRCFGVLAGDVDADTGDAERPSVA